MEGDRSLAILSSQNGSPTRRTDPAVTESKIKGTHYKEGRLESSQENQGIQGPRRRWSPTTSGEAPMVVPGR